MSTSVERRLRNLADELGLSYPALPSGECIVIHWRPDLRAWQIGDDNESVYAHSYEEGAAWLRDWRATLDDEAVQGAAEELRRQQEEEALW